VGGGVYLQLSSKKERAISFYVFVALGLIGAIIAAVGLVMLCEEVINPSLAHMAVQRLDGSPPEIPMDMTPFMVIIAGIIVLVVGVTGALIKRRK